MQPRVPRENAPANAPFSAPASAVPIPTRAPQRPFVPPSPLVSKLACGMWETERKRGDVNGEKGPAVVDSLLDREAQADGVDHRHVGRRFAVLGLLADLDLDALRAGVLPDLAIGPGPGAVGPDAR